MIRGFIKNQIVGIETKEHKVMKKYDEGYSLNNAFCYYQINQHYEEVGKETLNYETKD